MLVKAIVVLGLALLGPEKIFSLCTHVLVYTACALKIPRKPVSVYGCVGLGGN